MRRHHKAHVAAELDGFAELERIGDGAFTDVFRAVEVSTGRRVVLKVLKVEALHPNVVEAFAEEVRALGALSGHPNVVTLYRSITTSEGQPALVLELCRGSLPDRLRTAPMTARDTVALGIKLAGALETAHRAGFLHRDVKPGSVLLTQFGEPVLSEFCEQLLLSAAYGAQAGYGPELVHAPPEVLEDKPLGAATDVYGLASTLYEAVSGRAPFSVYDGESPASVILRILRDPVPPLRGGDIPLVLADLLDISLSKEPGVRPPSAAAFADALRAVEEANGWPATASVVWGEAPPWPAPRPAPLRFPPAPGVEPAGGGAGEVPPSPWAPSPAVAPVAAAEPSPAPTPVPQGPGQLTAAASRPPDPIAASSGPSVVAAVATPRNVIPPTRADEEAPPEPRPPGLGAPEVPPLPLPAGSNPMPLPPWSSEARPWWSGPPSAWSGPPDGGPHPSWPPPPPQEAAWPRSPEAPPPWPPAEPAPPAWRQQAPQQGWEPPSQAMPRWSPPEGGWPPPLPPQPQVGWPNAGDSSPPLRAGSRKRRWRPRREPKAPPS